MFEGYLHELLAQSLGSLLDISREQLRISLWSGKFMWTAQQGS